MEGESELILALRAGDIDAIRRAIEAEPGRALSRDAVGTSLLMMALYHRQFGLVEFLLERVGTIDCFEAAALGRTYDLVSAAGRSRGVITSRSPDGFTLLHLAAHFGHVDTVQWLLKQGAPVDAVAANPGLARPLHSAVAAGSARIAMLLLDAGAEPNAPQRSGFTPLHAAAHRGDADLVDLLLARGSDPRCACDDGRKPADFARDAGHAAIAARLSKT